MRKIEKTFPRTKRCLCESCREDKGTRTHSGRFNSVLLKCTVCRTLDTLVFATIEPIEQEVARIFFSGGESEIHFSNLKFFFSFSRSQPTNLQFWRLAPRPPHSSNALAILLPPTDALRWILGGLAPERRKNNTWVSRDHLPTGFFGLLLPGGTAGIVDDEYFVVAQGKEGRKKGSCYDRGSRQVGHADLETDREQGRAPLKRLTKKKKSRILCTRHSAFGDPLICSTRDWRFLALLDNGDAARLHSWTTLALGAIGIFLEGTKLAFAVSDSTKVRCSARA